jgi:hypothetical protein
MKTAVLSAIVAAQLTVPVADNVPTLNVASSCRAAADINKTSGLADPQSYDNCMADEESARKELVPIWTSFRAPDRSRCESEASSGGVYSYVELLVCLQLARDAAALTAPTASNTPPKVTPLRGASKTKAKARLQPQQ